MSMPRSVARVGALVAWAAALVALGFTFSGCGAPSEDGLLRVRRTGVLRWGADQQGGEPFAYEDPARPGHLIG
ncbi:MAG: Amino acid transporter binding protein and permease protein, partial [Myxococcales bacterium]|nr:Amino acid transporter binding protein and permease protein [Myxococcales bacterium]